MPADLLTFIKMFAPPIQPRPCAEMGAHRRAPSPRNGSPWEGGPQTDPSGAPKERAQCRALPLVLVSRVTQHTEPRGAAFSYTETAPLLCFPLDMRPPPRHAPRRLDPRAGSLRVKRGSVLVYGNRPSPQRARSKVALDAGGVLSASWTGFQRLRRLRRYDRRPMVLATRDPPRRRAKRRACGRPTFARQRLQEHDDRGALVVPRALVRFAAWRFFHGRSRIPQTERRTEARRAQTACRTWLSGLVDPRLVLRRHGPNPLSH